MIRIFHRCRRTTGGFRAALLAIVPALALVIAACGSTTAGDSPAFVPVSGVDDSPAGAGDAGASISGAVGDNSVATDDGSDPPFVLRLDLDLDLEEPPTEEPQTLDDKVEQSGYLEVAPEPDKAVLSQTGCSELAAIVVDLQQDLLDAVGDAERTDIAAVDAAFEQHGVNGTLVARHADQLGCAIDEMTAVICRAKSELVARGEVGRDIIELAFGSC